MNVVTEKLEKNMAKMTVEVEAADFEKSMQKAYQKQKGRISIPGFRKGKVDRAVIERMYGPQVFYDDAARFSINENYPLAADESGLDIVSRPEIEVTEIKKGEKFVFTALVAVKPEVKLGQYEGIELTAYDANVTDDEVEKEIERQLNTNARTIDVTDRAVQENDTAVIDFDGYVDGEAFEGGKGENYSLVIGSHSFIDNFEDQLIGHSIGDELDVNVTFPEEYHAAELAGKPAVFKVKINAIKAKEIPELDDEYVSDISEYDTVDAYREGIKKELTEKKEKEAKADAQEEAVELIVKASEMEIPDAMIEYQIDGMIDDFAARLSMQGLSIDKYFEMSGVNEDRLREQMRDQALASIQGSLVLEAIAKDQNFEVSEAEVDEEIYETVNRYYMSGDAQAVKNNMSEKELNRVREDVAKRKALDYIIDKASFTKKASEAN